MQQMIRLARVLSLLVVPTVFAQSPPGPAVLLDTVTLDPTKLRVHFIDIGPGLAVLIETPHDRRHIFVDGGKWSLDEMMTYVGHFVSPPLPIDIAIVTHADTDHYKGMKRIFETYEVGQFWNTGYESDTLANILIWAGLLQQVDDEEGCEVYMPIEEYVEVGDTEVIDDGDTPTDPSDDVVVHYLNVDSSPPFRDPIFGRSFSEAKRRNNASLVFRLVYKNVSFLITGDINGRDGSHKTRSTDNEIDSEELELLVRHMLFPDRYNLKSTVLQAPHHGSNGSCSLPFIKAVDPDWVVITAGHQHNLPHPATLERIGRAGVAESRILRTDEGDSTPENTSVKDPTGDDSYIFETDGDTITRILKVKLE
ncbi:MAG: MBL fold metallo-hydrolase [Planctomycetes bacterium]|nr:MBL fold metallo-hydrolase [Planctomycetota bacterium]